MKKRLNAYEVTLVALLKTDLMDKAARYYDNWTDKADEDFMFYVRRAIEEIEREKHTKQEDKKAEQERARKKREEWWEFM